VPIVHIDSYPGGCWANFFRLAKKGNSKKNGIFRTKHGFVRAVFRMHKDPVFFHPLVFLEKSINMTKLVRQTAMTVIMALAMFTHSAQAQKENKIAVVDFNIVVAAMPEYIAATTKIQNLTNAYQDSLKNMVTKYQATKDTYAKLETSASPETKKKAADDLQAIQDAANAFQQAKFGNTGEIAQTQQNLMKPITDKLNNTIESYAKKEHLSLIIPKGQFMYADPATDATTKFQDYLKAQ
jgi:outer membrane protein